MSAPLRAAFAVLLLSCAWPTLAQDAEGKEHCTLPGALVAEDDPADGTIPQLEITSVYWAEPWNADDPASDKMHVSLKVGSLSPAPMPSSILYVKFILADGVTYFFSWEPFPLPGDAEFAYGHEEAGPGGVNNLVTDGETDPESSFNADGTITWVLSRSQLIALETSPIIGNITANSTMRLGVLVLTVDDTEAPGAYILQGNASCEPEGGKGGALAGGAPAPALLLVLGMLGALRRRA
jgi:hypothetical protein